MKLALINGSPKGKLSGSNTLLNWLVTDIKNEVDVTRVTVSDTTHHPQSVDAAAACDYLVCCFPLYTDLTPGIVQQFFELMEAKKADFKDKPILFLLHSGFPEAVQSRLLERYCRHFASLMGMKVMGCILFGTSGGVREAPEQFFKKKKDALAAIGSGILTMMPYDEDALILPGHIEKMSRTRMFLFSMFAFAMDMSWNRMLKKNGVFDQRFDRPYAPKN